MSDAISVLLVEDEPFVQAIIVDGLSDAGYEVTEARNGAEALRQMEAEIGKFRAIVTDVRLGEGPNGWAVGKRARVLSPKIAVVHVSGDSGGEWAANGVPHSLFLKKPYAISQVITAIAAMLNSDGSNER